MTSRIVTIALDGQELADTRARLADTQSRLAEAEETLRAIGTGEIDALVVSDGEPGPQVFILTGADRPYRIFVENMTDGAATLTENGIVLYANVRLGQLLGRPIEELLGAPIASLVAETARVAFDALVGGAGQGATVEIELVAQNNLRVPVLIGAAISNVSGQRLTCLTFTDLTAQKAAEKRLRTSEVRTIDILDAANEAFVGMDAAGRVTAWNRQAEVTFGWRREEVLGTILAETILPAESRADLARYIAGDRGDLLDQRFEHRAVDRQGREFPAEFAVWAARNGEDATTFHAFIHDISERRATEDAIRTARDLAVEGSRLKSQFLANMSHEIRTPMNGVLGMADLILDTDLDLTQRGYALILQESGHDLLTIINQILDFSKVEAGKVQLEDVDFDLAAIVESVASPLAPAAQDKGLALQVDLSPVLSWVRGDPGRLRQILTNLIGNAIKFTATGAVSIRVSAIADGRRCDRRRGDRERARFEVTDTGIGIDPAAGDTLLAPFVQADPSTTRRFGGTGLGLAICHQLVELMGGTLDYHSRLGKGSTFWFEIPLLVASAPTAPPVDNAVGPATTEHTPAVKTVESPVTRRRALLVDDLKINQVVATAMLERLGYRVDVASSGAIALDAVQASSYDVILMDCLMPAMDGYETTTRIRQLEATQNTCVIAVTASALAGAREKCLAAGMDDYISKPIRSADLKEALARCFPPEVGPPTTTGRPRSIVCH